jgi:hypothetical protein
VVAECRCNVYVRFSIAGKSKEDAMTEYAALVTAANADWRDHEVLKGFTE